MRFNPSDELIRIEFCEKNHYLVRMFFHNTRVHSLERRKNHHFDPFEINEEIVETRVSPSESKTNVLVKPYAAHGFGFDETK